MDNAEELKLQWRDGEPPKPYREEWFIARLTENGGRVVLRALPEDFTYDYKTADETYYMASRIKSWMQFPDSNYIAPKAVESEQARDAALRTALGWQQRAEIAERNWKRCREWAIAGGAPVEKLGDDPATPWHEIRDAASGAPAAAPAGKAPETKEMEALGAFLGAMGECNLSGKRMREAMLWALSVAGSEGERS